jgi:hypothetical protein
MRYISAPHRSHSVLSSGGEALSDVNVAGVEGDFSGVIGRIGGRGSGGSGIAGDYCTEP